MDCKVGKADQLKDNLDNQRSSIIQITAGKYNRMEQIGHTVEEMKIDRTAKNIQIKNRTAIIIRFFLAVQLRLLDKERRGYQERIWRN